MGPLFVMTKKINTIRLFVFTAHLTSSVQIAAVGARGSHGCTGIRRLDTTQASLSAVQAPSIPLGPCLCYRYFIWVISSSRILLQEIYPNYDVPHDRLRDITHDYARTRGDRFHLRDITHDSSWARVYLGREFPLPADLYKYSWSMNKEAPSSFCFSLFSYFGIPLVTRYQHIALLYPRGE